MVAILQIFFARNVLYIESNRTVLFVHKGTTDIK